MGISIVRVRKEKIVGVVYINENGHNVTYEVHKHLQDPYSPKKHEITMLKQTFNVDFSKAVKVFV